MSQMIQLISVPKHESFSYWYRPPLQPEPMRALVLVHGVTRDGLNMVKALADVADRHNLTLIAPNFSSHHYPDYQRLGRNDRGARADLAFLDMIDDCRARFGISAEYTLLGFSGGAQFVHRFVMAHPQPINGVVLGAAGWYTNFDHQRAYPYGLRTSNRLPDIELDPVRLLRLPSLVVVGENDNDADQQLRQHPYLSATQGENRLERALNWHQQLLDMARDYAYPEHHQLCVLPHTRHQFVSAVRHGRLDHHLSLFCQRLYL